MSTVDVEVGTLGEGVATVTIDDPDRRNALFPETVRAIVDIFEAIEEDPDSPGRGHHRRTDPAFCAGGALSDLERLKTAADAHAIYEGFLAWPAARCRRSPPLTGRPWGPASTWPCAATYGWPPRPPASTPGSCTWACTRAGESTWMLRQVVGPQAAAAMVLFNQPVGGEEAERIGLAWRCVPEPRTCWPTAGALAARAAAFPTALVRRTKETLATMAGDRDPRRRRRGRGPGPDLVDRPARVPEPGWPPCRPRSRAGERVRRREPRRPPRGDPPGHPVALLGLSRRLLAGPRRPPRVPLGVLRGPGGRRLGRDRPARRVRRGRGRDPEAAVMLEEIAASGAAMNGASAVHLSIFGMNPVVKPRHGCHAPEVPAPRWPAATSHVSFGVTEPDAGTDTTNISTRAVPTDGGYRVTGRKIWTTKATMSEKVLLLVRTTPLEEVARRTDGMTLLLADLKSPNVDIRPIDKLGRNAVVSCEVSYDNHFVAEEDRVGEEGQGFRYLLDGLNPERIMIAAEAVGIGRVALNRAVRYAKERVVFGRPIGANQGIAFPLAEAHAKPARGRAGQCATPAPSTTPASRAGEAANAAKLLAAEAGYFAADRAVQTLGGMGYAREYDVERYWREARLMRIAPVSQEMALNYLAEHVLGLPAPTDVAPTMTADLTGVGR